MKTPPLRDVEEDADSSELWRWLPSMRMRIMGLAILFFTGMIVLGVATTPSLLAMMGESSLEDEPDSNGSNAFDGHTPGNQSQEPQTKEPQTQEELREEQVRLQIGEEVLVATGQGPELRWVGDRYVILYSDLGLYVTYSEDGVEWDEPILVDDWDGEGNWGWGARGSIMRRQDGSYFLVFVKPHPDNQTSIARFFSRTSTDGITWSEPKLIYVNEIIHYLPIYSISTLETSEGEIIVAFSHDIDQGGAISMMSSHDGETWEGYHRRKSQEYNALGITIMEKDGKEWLAYVDDSVVWIGAWEEDRFWNLSRASPTKLGSYYWWASLTHLPNGWDLVAFDHSDRIYISRSDQPGIWQYPKLVIDQGHMPSIAPAGRETVMMAFNREDGIYVTHVGDLVAESPQQSITNLTVLWSLDLTAENMVQASGSITVADLDGDGSKEILLPYRKPCRASWSPESKGDNRLLCATDSGEVKWIFPPLNEPAFPFAVSFLGHPMPISDPTVVDLDGDGRLEVLIGRRGGAVHCITHEGEELWNFSECEDLGSVSLDYDGGSIKFSGRLGSAATPQVYDNDGDGTCEIYVASGPTSREYEIRWGRLTVLTPQGELIWNVELDGLPSSPLVWDIDQDGDGEIVAALSNNVVVCLNANDGSEVWRRPIPGGSWYLQSTPIAADVDKDGRYEIIVGSNDGNLHVLNENGTKEWTYYTTKSPGKLQSSFPVADIDDDANLEISFIDDGYVQCVDLYTREEEWAFEPLNPDDSNNYNTFADVTGDGEIDVLVVTPTLHIFSNQGELLHEFETPEVHRDYWAQSGTWSGDLNGDGIVEILVKLTGDCLYCLTTGAPYDPGKMPWPEMMGNPMNRLVVPIP